MQKSKALPTNRTYPIIGLDIFLMKVPGRDTLQLAYHSTKSEGESYKAWEIINGCVTASQLSDISTSVARLVDEAIVSMITVKGLPQRP